MAKANRLAFGIDHLSRACMIWADLMLHFAVDRWDVNAPRHPS